MIMAAHDNGCAASAAASHRFTQRLYSAQLVRCVKANIIWRIYCLHQWQWAPSSSQPLSCDVLDLRRMDRVRHVAYGLEFRWDGTLLLPPVASPTRRRFWEYIQTNNVYAMDWTQTLNFQNAFDLMLSRRVLVKKTRSCGDLIWRVVFV